MPYVEIGFAEHSRLFYPQSHPSTFSSYSVIFPKKKIKKTKLKKISKKFRHFSFPQEAKTRCLTSSGRSLPPKKKLPNREKIPSGMYCTRTLQICTKAYFHRIIMSYYYIHPPMFHQFTMYKYEFYSCHLQSHKYPSNFLIFTSFRRDTCCLRLIRRYRTGIAPMRTQPRYTSLPSQLSFPRNFSLHCWKARRAG